MCGDGIFAVDMWVDLLMRLVFGSVGAVLILIGTQIPFGTFVVLIKNAYY